MQHVIDIALEEGDVESLLAGLIRVAFHRRPLLDSALDACTREAEAGSAAHAEAAERLRIALGFRHLWTEDR